MAIYISNRIIENKYNDAIHHQQLQASHGAPTTTVKQSTHATIAITTPITTMNKMMNKTNISNQNRIIFICSGFKNEIFLHLIVLKIIFIVFFIIELFNLHWYLEFFDTSSSRLKKLTITFILFLTLSDKLIMQQKNGIIFENAFNIYNYCFITYLFIVYFRIFCVNYNYVNNVQFIQNLIVLLFNSTETHRIEINSNFISIIIAIINEIVCIMKKFTLVIIAGLTTTNNRTKNITNTTNTTRKKRIVPQTQSMDNNQNIQVTIININVKIQIAGGAGVYGRITKLLLIIS